MGLFDSILTGVTDNLIPKDIGRNLPILGPMIQNQEIEGSLAGQNAAVDQAGQYMQQQLQQLQEMNQPLIQLGTEQLAALKQGIESGAFNTSDSMFQDYQQYVAPQYEPGGAFQYEPRENLVTPESFEVAKRSQTMVPPTAASLQRAGLMAPKLQETGGVRFGEQQPGQATLQGLDTGMTSRSPLPTAPQYSPTQQAPGVPQIGQYSSNQQAPTLQGPQQFQAGAAPSLSFDRGQAPGIIGPQQANLGQAPSLQFNRQQGPALQGPQQFQVGNAPALQQFSGQRSALPQMQQFSPQQYTGRDIQTTGQQYNAQAAPQQENVSSQFQTGNFQGSGQAPDLYRAGAAPDAQYYDPSAPENQFNVQNDPGYQRRYQQAMRAVEASAAAQGMQLSGANLKALQENAAQIASEETAAAYQRFTQDQSRLQGAQTYQTEDQYRRYLDQVGIKGSEADKAIAQFNQERAFGAEQNKESWLREQATKQLGMNLNDQQFSQWLASEGQQYQQFADQRDWSTSQSNQAAAADWQKYQYNTNLGYQTNQDLNAFNAANADRADARYNTDFTQNFQTNEQQQNQFMNQQQLGLSAQNAYQSNLQNFNAQQQDVFNANRQYGLQANEQLQNQYAQNAGLQLSNVGQINQANQAYNQQQQQAYEFGANYGLQQNEQLQNQYAQNAQLGFNAQNAYQGNLMNYNQLQQGAYQYAQDYGLQQNQQNVQNQLAQYGLSRDAFSQDRAFDYGAQQDLYQNQLQGSQLQNQYLTQDLQRRDTNIQQNNANAMNMYGMNLDQYNQNRDYATSYQNQQFNQNLATYGAQQGAYQNDVSNYLAMNNQNFNQSLAYQNMLDQNYNFDQNLGAQLNQQNFANTLDAYNINNQNYTADRAFNYGMYGDQQAQNFDLYQYNNALRGAESANQYGMLADQYNRNLTQSTNQYGMLSDLAKTGLTGLSNVSGATSDYYGSMADLALQRANAAAAAAAAKSANSGLMNMIGL